MPKRSSPQSSNRGKPTSQIKRQLGNREPKKYVLIVVEGQETEYNYFCELRRDLRLVTTAVEVVTASGGDPLVLVNKTYDLVEQNNKNNKREGKPRYNDVFCVFDEDNKPEKYKEACEKAKRYNFISITSIPCFEFWFLLHYCYTTSLFKNCSQLIKKLEAEQRKAGVLKQGESYDKGNKNMYEILKDKQTYAFENTARLEKQQTDSDCYANPSTLVHKLVEKLQNES
jgi:RloB-like protein